MKDQDIVCVENLTKAFKDHVIFDHFSLHIHPGEFVAVQGKSGSGKSTLLNCIGLLDQPDEGTITLFGISDIRPYSRQARTFLRTKIGYMFQNFALLPEKSVLYNLRLAADDIPSARRVEVIQQALERVGLAGYENKKVSSCSGGEQQRISLARLLIKPCELILADEPTGSLDSENREVVINLLKEMQKSGKTIVVVTHDPRVADSADRIITLSST